MRLPKDIIVHYEERADGTGIEGHYAGELIRCRECKYSDDMPIADGRYWCNYHNGYFQFCSEAERKDND